MNRVKTQAAVTNGGKIVERKPGQHSFKGGRLRPEHAGGPLVTRGVCKICGQPKRAHHFGGQS